MFLSLTIFANYLSKQEFFKEQHDWHYQLGLHVAIHQGFAVARKRLLSRRGKLDNILSEFGGRSPLEIANKQIRKK